MTKVLYIGGTGQISFDCIHASVQAGHETWVFNRGNNNAGLPAETKFLRGDMHVDSDYQQIAAEGFDVICQFHVLSDDVRLYVTEKLNKQTISLYWSTALA